MTSAFAPAASSITSPQKTVLDNTTNIDPNIESETEDEEVKMNCIGGLRGIEDSDMNTSDEDDDDSDDDDDDDDDQQERNQGVVNFVAEQVQNGPLVRPKATSPAQRTLVSHCESQSTTSSVGARGVALSSSRAPSAMSEVSRNSLSEDAGFDVRTPKADRQVSPSCDSPSGEEGCEDGGDGLSRSILDSLGDFDDEEAEDMTEKFIGVMQDREDPVAAPRPKKRVLTSSTLATETERSVNSPKRRKGESETDVFPLTLPPLKLPPIVSLGPPVSTEIMTLSRKSVTIFQRESPPNAPSVEEEALDRQLGEELVECDDCWNSRPNTPVALLTPPQSPLTIEVDGETTTVCEWPSNLYVDSAMTAVVNEIRPMSPDSLQDLEKEEENRVGKLLLRDDNPAEASTLTSLLLRGVHAGAINSR